MEGKQVTTPPDLGRGQPLERLYREQGSRMWRSVLAFCGDPEIASDAVAEAFAQAIRRGDAIQHPDRWIWKVAFRLAARELKERSHRVALEEGTYEMQAPAVELVEALRHLSKKQRAAVVLHHAGGYRVKEIAAILGSTSAAVRVQLSRGRKRLRQLLGDQVERDA
jgi:RNA polymerase sigma-70 factor, ECF subfamily